MIDPAGATAFSDAWLRRAQSSSSTSIACELERVAELGRERAGARRRAARRAEEDAPAVARLVFVDRDRLEGIELGVEHVLERAGARAGRESRSSAG